MQKRIHPPQNGGEAVIAAFYNQKGGVGKTMLTMQVAAALALRNYRVLVVDMDPQSTATMWSAAANGSKPFPATVVSLAAQSSNVIGELQKFSTMFDFILIDCRPALDDKATWAILHVADMGIIPTEPLLDSLWATTEAKEKGLEAKKRNESLQVFYLPSMVTQANFHKLGIQILESDEEVPTFKSHVSRRIAFPECQYMGTSVHSLGYRAKAAIDEIEQLTDEFLSYALSGQEQSELSPVAVKHSGS